MSMHIRIGTAGTLAALAFLPARGLLAQASQAEVLADSVFVRQAMSGNVLEMRLGTVARSKAANGAVKDFANRMVKDHTDMWKQWEALVKKFNVTAQMGAVADTAGKALAAQLAGLSGAEFDRAYMAEMVRDHQTDVSRFQQAASSADAADVRQLAAAGVPRLQEHLTLAQQVASQVGTTTVATAPTGNPTSQPDTTGQQSLPPWARRSPPPTSTTPAPAPAPAPAPNPTNGQVNPANNQGGNNGNNGNGNNGNGNNGNKGNANLNDADLAYANEVAVGHLMEVRLAEMAQRKAKDADVKRLADRLHEDFSKWIDRWSNLAGKEPHMGKLHQEKIVRLQKASDKQFDRTYLDIVIENLNSMIPYFQKEGRDAKSGRVRQLVNEELPVLQHDVQMAERIQKDKGKDLSLAEEKSKEKEKAK
jgi:putative membrane protein